MHRNQDQSTQSAAGCNGCWPMAFGKQTRTVKWSTPDLEFRLAFVRIICDCPLTCSCIFLIDDSSSLQKFSFYILSRWITIGTSSGLCWLPTIAKQEETVLSAVDHRFGKV